MRRCYSPQGGYSGSVVFRGAPQVLKSARRDSCAYSSGGNNVLPVTEPVLGPYRVDERAVQKKGVELMLNPLIFMVELARIELAAS